MLPAVQVPLFLVEVVEVPVWGSFLARVDRPRSPAVVDQTVVVLVGGVVLSLSVSLVLIFLIFFVRVAERFVLFPAGLFWGLVRLLLLLLAAWVAAFCLPRCIDPMF